MDCLKYARDHGCPWHEETCAGAAKYGHLDCLTYAHENGCPWGLMTCWSAAAGGHLDCLKYARENGCPWDERTCARAATHGHLDCLEYANVNGCPWPSNQDFLIIAEYGRYLACVAYAHEHGCPFAITDDGAMCYGKPFRDHIELRRTSAVKVSRVCRVWLARRRADVRLVLAGRMPCPSEQSHRYACRPYPE